MLDAFHWFARSSVGRDRCAATGTAAANAGKKKNEADLRLNSPGTKKNKESKTRSMITETRGATKCVAPKRSPGFLFGVQMSVLHQR